MNENVCEKKLYFSSAYPSFSLSCDFLSFDFNFNFNFDCYLFIINLFGSIRNVTRLCDELCAAAHGTERRRENWNRRRKERKKKHTAPYNKYYDKMLSSAIAHTTSGALKMI